jgi:hypothetical protein
MRHESNYNSVNQFYNGGWELVDSDGVPAFWDIEGASLEDDLSVYEVTPDGLKVQLGSQSVVKVTQTFTEPAGPFDFSGDLEPGDYRGMPNGYIQAPARTLSGKDLWTVSFDVARTVGPCEIKVSAKYVDNTEVYLTASTGGDRVTITDLTEVRVHFFHEANTASAINEITIELRNASPAEVILDRMQLSLGQYADQPYTGDPFVQIFPKDCLVLVLGEVCPAGFEELGDGDLQVPADWSEQEPGIRPRKGNYPASGTDLAGSPKHGPENGTSSTATNIAEGFESRFGRAYLEVGTGPDSWIEPSNNPLVDQELDHTHEMNLASSRVLAVEYLFCKRV